jgi:hypothetical protein
LEVSDPCLGNKRTAANCDWLIGKTPLSKPLTLPLPSSQIFNSREKSLHDIAF